jgi:hypothetical protein
MYLAVCLLQAFPATMLSPLAGVPEGRGWRPFIKKISFEKEASSSSNLLNFKLTRTTPVLIGEVHPRQRAIISSQGDLGNDLKCRTSSRNQVIKSSNRPIFKLALKSVFIRWTFLYPSVLKDPKSNDPLNVNLSYETKRTQVIHKFYVLCHFPFRKELDVNSFYDKTMRRS